MNREEQCKDLQRIIEEERELQCDMGYDDITGMLLASAIYAESYRKVPIGSVIVPIEERETIEKQIEELQGNGTEFETKIIKLIEQAKVFFDMGVRSKTEYTTFRYLLDICYFALNTQNYINEKQADLEAEIKRLKADNTYAVKEFAACAMIYADEIRVDENGDEIYTIRGSRIDECVNKWFKENEQPKPWEE